MYEGRACTRVFLLYLASLGTKGESACLLQRICQQRIPQGVAEGALEARLKRDGVDGGSGCAPKAPQMRGDGSRLEWTRMAEGTERCGLVEVGWVRVRVRVRVG